MDGAGPPQTAAEKRAAAGQLQAALAAALVDADAAEQAENDLALAAARAAMSPSEIALSDRLAATAAALVASEAQLAEAATNQAALHAKINAMADARVSVPGAAVSVTPVMHARPPPPPDKWAGEKSSKLPRGKIWFALVLTYCAMVRWDIVQQFMFFLQGPAVEWFYSLTQAFVAEKKILTPELLQAEFLSTYDPGSRSDKREARHKLMTGQCTMNTFHTVKKYSAEFLLLCRLAEDFAMTDQIVWFLHGLSATLGEMCEVDQNGKDWLSLTALMDYAYGCEQRLEAGKKNNKAVKSLNYVVRPPNTPKLHNPTQKSTGQRTLKRTFTAGASGSGASGPHSKVGRPSGGYDSIASLPQSVRGIWEKRGSGAGGSNELKVALGSAVPMSEKAFLHHINNGKCVHCHEKEHVFQNCPHRN